MATSDGAWNVITPGFSLLGLLDKTEKAVIGDGRYCFQGQFLTAISVANDVVMADANVSRIDNIFQKEICSIW